MDITVRRSIVSGDMAAPVSIPMAHRALAAASLSPAGQSVISNLPDTPEIKATVSACNSFGADIVLDGGVADVFGAEELFAPKSVDCAGSGATLRLFLPLAALLDRGVQFNGNLPSKVSLEPFCAYLESLGAQCAGTFGRLPIKVQGPMQETEMVYLPRFGTGLFSGMLLSFPLREIDSEMGIDGKFVRSEIVDATLSLMGKCGLEAQFELENVLMVPGGQSFEPLGDYAVPGSPYLSSFFILAGALSGKVRVQGAGESAPLKRMLSSFKAQASFSEGAISLSAGSLFSAELDSESLGAYLPHALLLSSVAEGESSFSGFSSLKGALGRTARIMARELGRMGAVVREEEGSLFVQGGSLAGAEIEPDGDAAAAMCCSVAALCAKGPSRIKGAECILARHPNFIRDMARLGAIMR